MLSVTMYIRAVCLKVSGNGDSTIHYFTSPTYQNIVIENRTLIVFVFEKGMNYIVNPKAVTASK